MKKFNLSDFKEAELPYSSKILGGNNCTPTGSGTYNKGGYCFNYSSDWRTDREGGWTIKYCGISDCEK